MPLLLSSFKLYLYLGTYINQINLKICGIEVKLMDQFFFIFHPKYSSKIAWWTIFLLKIDLHADLCETHNDQLLFLAVDEFSSSLHPQQDLTTPRDSKKFKVRGERVSSHIFPRNFASGDRGHMG